MTKNQALRNALNSGTLFTAMAAHNPLAAKSSPKDTSLRTDGRQELLRIEEVQGKIAAAATSRTDSDFVVIARVEALIAGLGQDEAIKRGLAYEDAGADAILIHSKQVTPNEILSFVDA